MTSSMPYHALVRIKGGYVSKCAFATAAEANQWCLRMCTIYKTTGTVY